MDENKKFKEVDDELEILCHAISETLEGESLVLSNMALTILLLNGVTQMKQPEQDILIRDIQAQNTSLSQTESPTNNLVH